MLILNFNLCCDDVTCDKIESALHFDLRADRQGTLNYEHLAATLAEFDAVCDVSRPEEKGHLIRSLVTLLDCTPQGEVRVAFAFGANPETGFCTPCP